jgi:hypothetical protein
MANIGGLKGFFRLPSPPNENERRQICDLSTELHRTKAEEGHVGALAFSRRVTPLRAISILKKIGDVPDDLSAL